MGSERLPGKILAPLGGRPALALLVGRIRAARVDDWWLATSSDPADDVTEAWGFELGLRVFRGDPTEVLQRFLAVGAETRADWLVRVTGDNPFLDAPVIDRLIEARDDCEAAKAAELLRLHGGLPVETEDGVRSAPRLPLGYGVELVRRDALERADRAIPAAEPWHRVHVTSWLAAHGRIHEAPTPVDWPDRPGWRWTIDTYEDLAMARSAFRLFGERGLAIDYPEMVRRLDVHPEITAMNAHVAQREVEDG